MQSSASADRFRYAPLAITGKSIVPHALSGFVVSRLRARSSFAANFAHALRALMMHFSLPGFLSVHAVTFATHEFVVVVIAFAKVRAAVMIDLSHFTTVGPS